MKNILLVTALIFATTCCFAQTYFSLAPALTNDAGTIAEKANVALEFGRQWDVFSLGLDIGKTSLGKINGRDTTGYLEIRPNLNIFQEGKFTNTFTAGVGYIFNSKQNLLTELTSGIEYTWTPQIHINVYFGQYYYSGKEAASSTTFFGLSGVFFFLPSHPKSLITRPQGKS